MSSDSIPRPGPDFEAAVLSAFRATTDWYCQEANATTGVGPRAIHVEVVVATVHPLGKVRDRIREEAHQYVRGRLRRDRVRVEFDIDRSLAAPGYEIEIRPPVRRFGPAEDPRPGCRRRAGNAAGCLVFTLSCGGLEWTYRLYPVDRWTPIGRRAQAGPDGTVVRLPDSAVYVPRGGLLDLWYQPGQVWLRRSRLRAEYTVLVDGQVLLPHTDVELSSAGSIEYARRGREPTVLGYRMVLRRE